MDRRTLPRLPMGDTRVRIKRKSSNILWPKLSPPFQVYNISRSGMCFHYNASLNIGDRLHLKVSFADGTNIRLKGVVRWIARLRDSSMIKVGIQFLPFGSHRDYNELHALEYLRKLLPPKKVTPKNNH